MFEKFTHPIWLIIGFAMIAVILGALTQNDAVTAVISLVGLYIDLIVAALQAALGGLDFLSGGGTPPVDPSTVPPTAG